MTSLGVPRNTRDKPGYMDNNPGCAKDMLGRAEDKIRSAGDQPGSILNHCRVVGKILFFWNSAHVTGNYSYYLSFNNFQYSRIQFGFSSMYQYSYPSVNGISGKAAVGCLRAIRGAPEDENHMNSEIHSKAIIERVWRSPWTPWSGNFRDALGDRDRVDWEMHIEAKIQWTEKCAVRPWSSKIGGVLGGGGWKACW